MNDIITALIASLGVIISAFIGKVWERRKQNTQENKIHKAHVLSVAGMRSQVRIKHNLDELRAMGIDRVLIIRVNNGGKLPRPGSTLYASAIDTTTWSLDLERDILNKYSNVKVDAQYIEMCAQVATTPDLPYKINVSDKPTNLLEGWYKTENVIQSWVYNLFLNTYKDDQIERFEQYIISLAMYNHNPEDKNRKLEDFNGAEIERIINNIRQEFIKFYK